MSLKIHPNYTELSGKLLQNLQTDNSMLPSEQTRKLLLVKGEEQECNSYGFSSQHLYENRG